MTYKSIPLLLIVLILLFGCLAGAEENIGIRVVEFKGTLSSFPMPIKDDWKETGPITISLGEGKPGEIDPETRIGRIVWPVRLEAPLFRDLGLEFIETSLVGLIDFNQDEPISVDYARVIINPIDLVASVVNVNKGRVSELEKHARLEGIFTGVAKVPFEFRMEALKVASEVLGAEFENPEEILEVATEIQLESGHEIVIFYPEYGKYVSADLEGKFVFETF